MARLGFMAALACLALAGPARAAGPVETSVYAVTGVDVDITDTDATTAKTKAIIEAQVKAFGMLAERLGGPEAAAQLKKTPPDVIGRMLKSLSIEEERSGPGRYIGKLTVRFLPAKIKAAFGKYGIEALESQTPPVIVIPVWTTVNGLVLWEDNPWRQAWINLHAEQSSVPLIVPLGDLEDTRVLNAEQAVRREPIMLDLIKKRYGAKSVLVAIAAPQADNGVHAIMNGESPLGKINFDKKYTADEGTVEASAALAATRFQGVMVEKWRSVKNRAVADAKVREEQKQQAATTEVAAAPVYQNMSVAVPFTGASEWNALRRQIKGTPGVAGLDISTISGTGAVITLSFSSSLQSLRASMQSSGLKLDQIGGTWVIQPL